MVVGGVKQEGSPGGRGLRISRALIVSHLSIWVGDRNHMALKRQPRLIPTHLHSLEMHFDLQADNNNNNKGKQAFFCAKLSQRFQLAGFGAMTKYCTTDSSLQTQNHTLVQNLYLTFKQRRRLKGKNHRVKCQFGSSVCLKLG